MVADIDLESEKLRCLGEARFTIWALLRVLKLRRYKAALSFLGDDIKNKSQSFADISVRKNTSSLKVNDGNHLNESEFEESKSK